MLFLIIESIILLHSSLISILEISASSSTLETSISESFSEFFSKSFLDFLALFFNIFFISSLDIVYSIPCFAKVSRI